MKRIILEIDHMATLFHTGKCPTQSRFVVRSEKICGCQEMVDGTVLISVKQTEDSPVYTVAVTNEFDEVAGFMV